MKDNEGKIRSIFLPVRYEWLTINETNEKWSQLFWTSSDGSMTYTAITWRTKRIEAEAKMGSKMKIDQPTDCEEMTINVLLKADEIFWSSDWPVDRWNDDDDDQTKLGLMTKTDTSGPVTDAVSDPRWPHIIYLFIELRKWKGGRKIWFWKLMWKEKYRWICSYNRVWRREATEKWREKMSIFWGRMTIYQK